MSVDKKILSIDADDDDVDYKSFVKYIGEDTDRTKNVIAKDFNQFGDDLLAEIDAKNIKRNIRKEKQIVYILKHDENSYSHHALNSYSFEDINNIYNELREKRSVVKKLIHFIFNL